MSQFDRSLFRSKLWTAAQTGLITPSAFMVGMALLFCANKKGEAWPALAWLAARTGRCEKTASRAIRQLRLAGLVFWRERRVTWNRFQSHAYQLVAGLKKREPKEKIKERGYPAKLSDGSAVRAPGARGSLLGGVFEHIETRISAFLAAQGRQLE